MLTEDMKNMSWWDLFLEENKDNEVFKDILKELKNADTNESEESLNTAIGLINNLDKKEYKEDIKKFNKRVRILQKRFERKISENFGSMLKHLREEKGLSLARLGDIAGISPSYINRIELGERNAPSYPIIEKIAEALNVPIYTLLGVAGVEDESSKAVTLAQLLYSNNAKLTNNSKILTSADKEKFIKIVEFINDMTWKNNKHTEMLQLIEFIDDFKN